MTGQCYIDGRDIYSDFGVIITDGGYDDFFKLPGMVEPDKNDWAEHDGIEVDLSTPLLRPREIVVSFASVSAVQWRLFIEFLTTPIERVVDDVAFMCNYREVTIPYLARTWTLRYESMTELGLYNEANLFEIKFIEDNPAIPVATVPVGTVPFESVLELDGVSLDKYGIIVEDGLDDFDKTPPLKRNLTRTSSAISGQIYDAGTAVFAEKEITVRCTMISANMPGLWAQLDALFATLVQPDERSIGRSGRSYNAYYRGCANAQLLSHASEVAVRFDLKMNVMAFRIGLVTYLLAAEDGSYIITEDGFLIDITT